MKNIFFYLTCIYGDLDANLCVMFGLMLQISMSHNLAWGSIGDFNEILSRCEKEGLRMRDHRIIDNFKAFVEDNGLVDMCLK